MHYLAVNILCCFGFFLYLLLKTKAASFLSLQGDREIAGNTLHSRDGEYFHGTPLLLDWSVHWLRGPLSQRILNGLVMCQGAKKIVRSVDRWSVMQLW